MSLDQQNDKLEFFEVETKYRVNGDLVYAFKQLASKLPDLKKFVYVESDDIYYTKEDEFLRYRFSNSDDTGRAELTYKSKIGTTNNIFRKEVNLRVDPNSAKLVEEFVTSLGFVKNFRISKIVHIYRFEDATLPFYTVISENGSLDHFIEIEVSEDLLPGLNQEQAWAIIKKYEELLAPLGISHKNRLRKSLFEMYRR